jgi:Ca-activated chloride channel family protein
MQGKYEDAVQVYDRALQLKPGWEAAENNRQIAEIRGKMKERPEGDQGGTTEIGADEIVFDESGKKNQGRKEDEVESEGKELSQNEIQAMWLRRVQTRPADFLRTKFAYQYTQQKRVNAGATDEGQ